MAALSTSDTCIEGSSDAAVILCKENEAIQCKTETVLLKGVVKNSS